MQEARLNILNALRHLECSPGHPACELPKIERDILIRAFKEVDKEALANEEQRMRPEEAAELQRRLAEREEGERFEVEEDQRRPPSSNGVSRNCQS